MACSIPPGWPAESGTVLGVGDQSSLGHRTAGWPCPSAVPFEGNGGDPTDA